MNTEYLDLTGKCLITEEYNSFLLNWTLYNLHTHADDDDDFGN